MTEYIELRVDQDPDWRMRIVTRQAPPCRWCGRRTANPTDIAERYCPCCGGPGLPKGCGHRPTDQLLEGARD